MSDAATSRSEISIEPVTDKRGREAFVDCGRAFSDRLENFVPQIRSEQHDKMEWLSELTPKQLGVVSIDPENLSVSGLLDYIRNVAVL